MWRQPRSSFRYAYLSKVRLKLYGKDIDLAIYKISAVWRQRDEVRGMRVAQRMMLEQVWWKVFTQFSLWKLRMYEDEECPYHQDDIIKLWNNVSNILILWTNWEIGGGGRVIKQWSFDDNTERVLNDGRSNLSMQSRMLILMNTSATNSCKNAWKDVVRKVKIYWSEP